MLQSISAIFNVEGRDLRIRLPRAIRPNNGREEGVAEKQNMVSFVGFEVCL
jgi:hypothetical protein